MKIEHIAIWVRDLEKMKQFYVQNFNAECNQKYTNKATKFSSYFLTFSSGARLELMFRPDIVDNNDKSTFGLAHFAVSVGSKDLVNQMTELFRKDGIEILGEPRTTGDGYYESVILDPEGNKIELTI